MKRICSNCKCDLGEKCAKCGSESVIRSDPLFADSPIGVLFTCRQCQARWSEGSDGVTHGLCERCLEQAQQQLRPRA